MRDASSTGAEVIPEPTDKELLEFVARFAGWRKMTGNIWQIFENGNEIFRPDHGVPDYLHSLDAFSRDLFPKLTQNTTLLDSYATQLAWEVLPHWKDEFPNHWTDWAFISDATAKQRCLALYRALDGQLPKEKRDAD